MKARLELRGVGMRYGAAEVLSGVTAEMAQAGLVSIVGPNGAGKSTLLRIIAGLLPGYQGTCGYHGVEICKWPRRELARKIAFVPQALRLEFPFTAEQVVMMGRTPFCAGMFESPRDHEAVEHAMKLADAGEFRARDFRTLSGGEKQRVILASALAQEPETLLLDEPTTFLDLRHQVGMYRLLREQAARGLLALAATHDLNLALTYSDRVLILDRGRIVADGMPAEVLRPERIEAVFGVHATLVGERWIAYE